MKTPKSEIRSEEIQKALCYGLITMIKGITAKQISAIINANLKGSNIKPTKVAAYMAHNTRNNPEHIINELAKKEIAAKGKR